MFVTNDIKCKRCKFFENDVCNLLKTRVKKNEFCSLTSAQVKYLNESIMEQMMAPLEVSEE